MYLEQENNKTTTTTSKQFNINFFYGIQLHYKHLHITQILFLYTS